MSFRHSSYPHRGEVYLYDFGKNRGSVQNGIRPVMIIQNENCNASSPNVIIAAITSSRKNERRYSYHVVLPTVEWLPKRSMVLLEQVRTISQSELGPFCGRITDSETKKLINAGLMRVLELKRNPVCNNRDLICLCGKCVNFYYSRKDYSVKRVTPLDGDHSTCDKCGRYGAVDYIVKELYRSKASLRRVADL